MSNCEQLSGRLLEYSPLKLVTGYELATNKIFVCGQNNGRNIIYIKRIIICVEKSDGTKNLYFVYKGGAYDLFVTDGKINSQSSSVMLSKIPRPSGTKKVLSQAEYIEVTGRALSQCIEL